MELEPFVFRHEGRLRGMRWLPSEDQDTRDGIAEAVNRLALRPLAEDEYAVFSLDLCHDQVDRHFSRFPAEELEKINRMVVGRPLMERHDLRGSLPRGTFFRSELVREESNGGARMVVRPDVYVLRSRENADFILNIEGGVYRETSIGFSFETPECSVCGKDLRTCDHIPGRTYGGASCHYIMRGILDVIEGSVVPAGSQGTQFVACKSRCAGTCGRAARPLSETLEMARRGFHRPIEVRATAWAAGWAAE